MMPAEKAQKMRECERRAEQQKIKMEERARFVNECIARETKYSLLNQRSPLLAQSRQCVAALRMSAVRGKAVALLGLNFVYNAQVSRMPRMHVCFRRPGQLAAISRPRVQS